MNAPQRLPYPGLRPFRRDEADLFFGREASVDEMVARLARTRFLAVLGPSGSGKSSLVRTGLLDALELGLMAAAGPRWLIADMRPGARPIENLARALIALPRAGAAREPPQDFARQLRRGPRSLIAWCSQGNLPERTNLLLLIDQFEELFRYADLAGRDEAEAFVSLLINSAAAEDLPIYVVLTMRSEFLGPSALIPGLAERINQGIYVTRRLTREEMRAAIVGPASVCGFTIEPVLVNTLLNDLASFAPWEGERGVEQFQLLARRADQLPLLQHVLNRLWLTARAAEPSQRVTLTGHAYEALGGLAGALDAHAEEVLAGIPPEHRPAAEPLFRALVSGSSIATAVRRPCRIAELVTLAGGHAAAVAAVVEAFRDPGCNFLVTAPPGPLEPETTVDISHESLIRQWQRLSEWLNAEAKAAEEYSYLEETASRWAKRQSGLLRMPYLATALAWRARENPSEAWAKRYGGDFPLAIRFLEQSGARRQLRRRSLIALGALACLLVIVGTPIFVHQQLVLRRLRAAAAADNAGISAMNGQQGYKDYAAAIRWFKKALALGSVDAAYQMGQVYEYGYGVTQNDQQAVTWYRIAADKHHPGAEAELGYFYDEGRGTRQDFGQAMFWYQRAALQGNAAAENNIGYLYDNGRGVKPDPKQALVWYKRSFHDGDGAAAYNIGWDYENGAAVARNYGEAMKWYLKGAYLGNAGAEFEIGYFYEQGMGVPQDYAAAMKWYEKSAAAGNSSAENSMGRMFQNGHAVPRDYTEAMLWFRKAAAHGNASAGNSIGYLYGNGLGVAADPKQALEWYRKSAAGGNATAAYNIGVDYRQGTAVPRDLSEALKWFLESAKQGDADAALQAGYFYEHGMGVAKDYAAAMRWYNKSADAGNATAENNIGFMYQKGQGVQQDYVKAMQRYRKAAADGNHHAEAHVGHLYEHGLGVQQDYSLAASWYRKAALGGDAMGQFSLGSLYASGKGVPQDSKAAIFWFAKDAAQGDADGVRRAGEILIAGGSFDAVQTWLARSAQLAQAELARNARDPDAKRALQLIAVALGNFSGHLLLSGAFAKALDAADAAITLAPDVVWLQVNRADALMLLGRTDAARAIYLRYAAVANDGSDGGKSFKQDVLTDFAAFRTHGFTNPLMAEIEADFQN